jgi:hypothetical protein
MVVSTGTEPFSNSFGSRTITVTRQKYPCASANMKLARAPILSCNPHNMPPRRSFGTEISGNTSKKPYLSPAQRQTIIAKFDAGISVRQLADEFERGVQTIRDTIKRWNLHQTTSDLPRSGRKPMLSLHQKKLICRKARAQPKIEYENLVETGTFVNADGTPSKAPSRSIL